MIPRYERQTKEGLNGITVMSLFYFGFMVAVMVLKGGYHPAVMVNRLVCIAIYYSIHIKLKRGQIAPEWYNRVSMLAGLVGLGSLAFSYVCGAANHIAMRIGLVIVFSSVSGLERAWCITYQAVCLATCAFLQIYFPSATDPTLNLAPPAVFTMLGYSILEARLQTNRLLHESHEQLTLLGEQHKQALARARASQASLDADVDSATQHLALTNARLQQAIDLQIGAFASNQELQRRMSEALGFQAMGKAAGAAAHDFNNLLSVIACSVELMEEELLETPASPVQERNSQTVAILSGEITRAIKVGRDILALSGKQIVRPRLFQLQAWLNESCISNNPRVVVRMDLGGIRPDLQIYGDYTQLCQVLSNLVRNAAEAMPSGGNVRVRLRHSASDLTVTIQDDGPGVVAWLEPLLFQPFLTTKENMLHSGLGLASALAVARQHGGELTYQPQPGQSGAVFCLRLPVDRGQA
ncbi:MAG: sensor histidine kinase [Candidatus Eremiobacteraeota bacterium]|nr:sensor histidine kinase [Candidatus Eremiobacteraeota bacterium]